METFDKTHAIQEPTSLDHRIGTAKQRGGHRQAASVAAPRLGVETTAAPVHDAAEIENAIVKLANEQDAGLVAFPHTVTEAHRALVINLAAHYRLPSIFAFRANAQEGALASYGIDVTDHLTRAAVAFSEARSRVIFRCRHPPSSSWQSISGPPRGSASPCRPRCSPAPTR